jgi:hypothetical protein
MLAMPKTNIKIPITIWANPRILKPLLWKTIALFKLY